MPTYMSAMGGQESFSSTLTIVKSRNLCDCPPYLSPWTTCVYCGHVTILTYEAVVVEKRDSSGNPVDDTIYAQSDIEHEPGCPLLDKSRLDFLPLAARKFEATSLPTTEQERIAA